MLNTQVNEKKAPENTSHQYQTVFQEQVIQLSSFDTFNWAFISKMFYLEKQNYDWTTWKMAYAHVMLYCLQLNDNYTF